jgi:hypothetical protein
MRSLGDGVAGRWFQMVFAPYGMPETEKEFVPARGQMMRYGDGAFSNVLEQGRRGGEVYHTALSSAAGPDGASDVNMARDDGRGIGRGGHGPSRFTGWGRVPRDERLRVCA